MEIPSPPKGSGSHPVALVVISANDLAASSAFYSRMFGWQLQKMSPELSAGVPPAGPMMALRSNIPNGFPGMVPYIGVPDVDATLARVVADIRDFEGDALLEDDQTFLLFKVYPE